MCEVVCLQVSYSADHAEVLVDVLLSVVLGDASAYCHTRLGVQLLEHIGADESTNILTETNNIPC